jgi:hypothetical protein
MSSRTRTVWPALPWMWLGLSVAWAVVILVTDQLAWPLALWIATTVGPLAALQARRDATSAPNDSVSDLQDPVARDSEPGEGRPASSPRPTDL